MRTPSLLLAPVVALAVACGGNDAPATCDPAAASPCSGGEVCEAVQGGASQCFAPIVVQGSVFDLAAPATTVAGARVVALDANASPIGDVAVTGADGAYQLTLPWTRTSAGAPAPGSFTLRADAAGYQTFPSGARVALPVDVAAATKGTSSWSLHTSATDIGLQKLAATGLGAISGTVDAPPTAEGVLVVAVPSSGPAVTAAAAKDGTFVVFNVPGAAAPGATYAVEAYAAGANYTPVSGVKVISGQTTSGIALHRVAAAAAGVVTGSAQIQGQNLPSAWTPTTSVILVIASTFDPTLGRGVSVPKLRAANIGGGQTFTIGGVPDGTYRVLGGFENDGLVFDTGGGASPPPTITVAGGTVTVPQPFKMTGAVTLASTSSVAFPTLTAPFGDVAPVTVTASATPTFAWDAYPSTSFYDVDLFDELGTAVASASNVTGTTWQPDLSAIPANAYYQLRVRAFQLPGPLLASQSEDLLGVFHLVP